MLMFRKLSLDDLDIIYNDTELRPLLTTTPKGEKFGVVLELDGQIIGGTSGYIDGDGAMIQESIIKAKDDSDIYRDGLIRALMHVLDLEGIKLLFVEPGEDMDIYLGIGFQRYDRYIIKSDIELGNTIVDDFIEHHTLYIDLGYFFCTSTC